MCLQAFECRQRKECQIIMPKVSCIVPVYNVEKYLRRCLDSLLSQTITDYEIICVNDCSPDGSLAILEEYRKKYPSNTKAS